MANILYNTQGQIISKQPQLEWTRHDNIPKNDKFICQNKCDNILTNSYVQDKILVKRN
jgi:hypothetical protein